MITIDAKDDGIKLIRANVNTLQSRIINKNKNKTKKMARKKIRRIRNQVFNAFICLLCVCVCNVTSRNFIDDADEFDDDDEKIESFENHHHPSAYDAFQYFFFWLLLKDRK